MAKSRPDLIFAPLLTAALLTGSAFAEPQPMAKSIRPPTPTAPAVTPKLADHVQQVTAFNISAVAFDDFRSEPGRVLENVRVVPVMKDGAKIGHRLFAIAAKSPLAILGLQNGDTVKAISLDATTFDLASQFDSLAIEKVAKSCTSVELRIIRKGKELTVLWRRTA